MTDEGRQPDQRALLCGRRVLAVLVLVGCLVVAARSPAAGNTESAITIVSKLQAGLLEIDRRTTTNSTRQREAAFAPLIASTHDLSYMARLSLGAAWEALAQHERGQFTEAFGRLSVLNYAARFRSLDETVFSIERARETGTRIAVSGLLLAPSEEPVHFEYLLHDTTDGWRIVNVVAEGVSELALQRTQFQEILTARGFSGLMSEIEGRINVLLAN